MEWKWGKLFDIANIVFSSKVLYINNAFNVNSIFPNVLECISIVAYISFLFQINAITTTVWLFMPAFLPQCVTYINDGANFIDGDNTKWLLEVSTDGYIKCSVHNGNNVICTSVLNYEHYDMIMEAKYPYDNKIPVHYKLLNRYVPQVLSGMKANRVHTCLYVSHLTRSTTILKCKYHEDTWKKIWISAKETYDNDEVLKPNQLNDNTLKIKEILNKYVENQVKFITINKWKRFI